MNATTKHTPGTMEVDQLGEGRCVVLHSPGGHQIIECGYNATAQEIARRYNTHGALLAALEEVQRALACDRDGLTYTHPEHGAICLEEVKYLVVDEALRLARGS